MHRSFWRIFLQVLVTVLLFGALWHVSGGEALVQRLAHVNALWLSIGVLLTAPATILAALRWCYTASSVGAPMRRRVAVREFYLSRLLNQVLPSGMAGDAVRTWRHSRQARGQDEQRIGAGPAVRAVLIERVANQVMFAPWVLVSLILWPGLPGAAPSMRVFAPLMTGSVLLVVAVGVAVIVARRIATSQVDQLLADARRALLTHPGLVIQLGLGALLTVSNLAVYACAAMAVAAPLSLYELLALVPAVLLSMTIPVSIGGWGLREAAALAVWTMAGLPGSDGLAISIIYGAVSLLGSLPGALVVLLDDRPIDDRPSNRSTGRL